MERKLVTIRTISEIKPIAGADRIELAVVDGWQCIVKKGEFKVGDLGLYFEIDSFLPAEDMRFEFLSKDWRNFKSRQGARIKTMRMRGEISQGLLLPLSAFPEIKPTIFNENRDWATTLGVVKWEKEDDGGRAPQKKLSWIGRKLKAFRYGPFKKLITWFDDKFPGILSVRATFCFPSFIPKTDEERIQNLIKKFEQEDYDKLYEVSIKLDGSSMTVYQNKGKFGVCSRNLELARDPDNRFWATALACNLELALAKLGQNVALQGELMGPGIQGNREGLSTYEFFLYKIYDIDKKRFLTPGERWKLFTKLRDELEAAKLKHVPLIGTMTLAHLNTLEKLLQAAEGKSLNADSREGIVYKDCNSDFSFKVISNSYLLQREKEIKREEMESNDDTSSV